MPAHRYDRTGRRLSPCVATLLNEMVIPPFKFLPRVQHRSDLGDPVTAASTAPPSLADLPNLEEDHDSDQASCEKFKANRRLVLPMREECADDPLEASLSLNSTNHNEKLANASSLTPAEISDIGTRVEGPMIQKSQQKLCTAKAPYSVARHGSEETVLGHSNGLKKSEGLESVRIWFKELFNTSYDVRSSSKRFGTATPLETTQKLKVESPDSSNERDLAKPLEVYNIYEIPLKQSRPRLARANGDFLRIYALENSMRLNGKLRESSANMFLKPKQTMDSGVVLGIATRFDNKGSRCWCDISESLSDYDLNDLLED